MKTAPEKQALKLDEFNLRRLLEAQEHSYAIALHELREGRKRSHWMWYIFPQLTGLGHSPTAEFYGISGLAEARAFLAHSVLGHRLREVVKAMLAHRTLPAAVILGELDSLKFRSCLTLFTLGDEKEMIFSEALEDFFLGHPDARTVELLRARGHV